MSFKLWNEFLNVSQGERGGGGMDKSKLHLFGGVIGEFPNKTEEIVSISGGVTYVMMQIYACAWQGVVIRESDVVGMFADMLNFHCFPGSKKPGVAALLLGNVLCCIDLVRASIEAFHKSMRQFPLSKHQRLDTKNSVVLTI